MARFRPLDREPAPERLERFCRDDYPEPSPFDAIKLWCAERAAWHAQHAIADRSALGDVVTLYRAAREARQLWAPGAVVADSVRDCSRPRCAVQCALRWLSRMLAANHKPQNGMTSKEDQSGGRHRLVSVPTIRTKNWEELRAGP